MTTFAAAGRTVLNGVPIARLPSDRSSLSEDRLWAGILAKLVP